ncbi:MAG: 3-oxoacyl-[acyl-carrier-protein] reductase [Opitutales bacterium]|nr:3-oxoacyl-[acyl-carrier-protein] reductase [Opitutales bacterium]
MTFENRVAVVTGAGRGIGKAIALSLASEGVHLVCVSRNEASCGAVAEEIIASGGKAEALALDVGDSAAVAAAGKELTDRLGHVDILVNNAGITKDGLLLRMEDSAWEDVIRTNLSSCFYWTKALAYAMARKRWGRIINMASVSGLMGNAGQANYSAAKAGILGLTKSVAREFASRNITCNAVAPGFIETDMTSALTEEQKKAALANVPLKRLGKASEIATLTTYLCSEEAAYITGQVFTVDGGMVM